MPAAPPPPASTTSPMITLHRTTRRAPDLAGALLAEAWIGFSRGLGASCLGCAGWDGAAGVPTSNSSDAESDAVLGSDVAATNALWQCGQVIFLPLGMGFLLLRMDVHAGHKILKSAIPKLS